MQITYTQTSYFKSCPAKYKFRYVDQLIPRKKDSTLLRGSVVHTAFEKYFNGSTKSEIIGYIQKTYDDAIAEATVEDEEDLIVSKYTSLGMFDFYPFGEMEFQKVFPEEEFDVKIDALKGVRLYGKVDGRVLVRGKWWVREVKTTSSLFTQAEQRAGVSYQGAGYIYGIQKKIGDVVVGLLFDFILSSRLRKRSTENAKEYGERIYEDYKNHKNHTETGLPLRESRLYRRYYSYRSPYQIQEFEKDLIKVARHMRDAIRKNDFVRNPDSCYFYGKECPYLKICWMEHKDKDMINAYYEQRQEAR